MTERLTAIAGSMFSGKTEELIRLIGRKEIAKRKVEVFKPIIDNRYGSTHEIVSHSGAKHDATPVGKSQEILDLISEDVDVVAIDEAQFFDEDIVPVIKTILDKNIEVFVAGLPLDFRGEPFGKMPILLAMADAIERLTAVCTVEMENGKNCEEEATRTQRFVDGKPADYSDPVILVGGQKEGYAARCPRHHIVPNKPKKILNKE
jgi:thymidine kinase